MASMLRPVVLNNGCLMPRLGVGTYQILGNQCQEIVERAVRVGYRHIDTAQSYENEQNVGAALYALERYGKVKRKDVFITTKLSSTNLNPKYVLERVEESLENLKSRYIDLFLIHTPWGWKDVGGSVKLECHNFQETWSMMEKAVTNGHVKSLGLSNFTEKQISLVMSNAKIMPQNVQLECHAYYQQEKLRKFFRDNQISCSAYSPLGAPDRPERHKVPENKTSILMEDPVVQDIATKHNVSPALVLIRFLLQQDLAVIPKTSNFDRLSDNFKVLNIVLDDSDMRKLKELDRNIRFFVFRRYKNHPYFPKNNEPF